MVLEKKWQHICAQAVQSIYIGVKGVDVDLPKAAFGRAAHSETLQVEVVP